MGFFSRLFGKKNNTSEWDELAKERDKLDLRDIQVRERYVLSCLEQMRDASNELDRLNAEYTLVTSYLTDMEEIEAIEPNTKAELERIAKHINELRVQHDKLVLTPSGISERDFDKMMLLGDDAVDGIKKLSEEESYKQKVKNDISRIEKERDAYSYRRAQVNASLDNAKGTATIAIIASVFLVVILFLLQMLLKLDVTFGYYVTVCVVAVTMTVVYLRYTDFLREKKKIDNTVSELILLENKVKIRYVNNKNLLDYLYTKYDVSSSAELRDKYDKFLVEKEHRRTFERNEAVYDDEMTRLLKILSKERIKDPEVWVHQTDAIYNNKEMIEIRHSLIGRRQKLRKQMEYNEQIAVEASGEIKDIIARYPDSSQTILDMVNKFGTK